MTLEQLQVWKTTWFAIKSGCHFKIRLMGEHIQINKNLIAFQA